MEPSALKGLIAATVTPMTRNHTLDEASLRRYVRWLAAHGVSGMAVNVDTGEGPHLFPEERARALEVVLEEVGGRVVVVAGLAATFTEQGRRFAREAAMIGADALLVFPIPAYQGEPLDPVLAVRYHEAVGEAGGLPMIAFQLQPALGGVLFPPDALARLLAVDAVVAIKEASFDARRFTILVSMLRELDDPPVLLNGNDNFLLEAYLLGAEGALLGFGTLAADQQVEMLEAVRAREFEQAHEIGTRVQALCDAIFAPPVRDYRARLKHALWRLEVIDDPAVRPPLLPLNEGEEERVDRAMKQAGLL
jgi:4-hydroxy-tetrahydrodipicolinate synthase